MIAARSYDDAVNILEIVRNYLGERGLMLSDTKTKISRVEDGFTFVSREYFMMGGTLVSGPSDESVARFKSDITDIIANTKLSQKELIDRTNRKVTGWATYHKIGYVDLRAYTRLLRATHSRNRGNRRAPGCRLTLEVALGIRVSIYASELASMLVRLHLHARLLPDGAPYMEHNPDY